MCRSANRGRRSRSRLPLPSALTLGTEAVGAGTERRVDSLCGHPCDFSVLAGQERLRAILSRLFQRLGRNLAVVGFKPAVELVLITQFLQKSKTRRVLGRPLSDDFRRRR